MKTEQNSDDVNMTQPINTQIKESLAGIWQIRAMGIGLILFGLILAYCFLTLWPQETVPNESGLRSINWLGGDRLLFKLNHDVQLLLLVMMAGGLGSFIHTATSFGDYVGNHNLNRSWFWWYILRPFIGMALAAIFYLVIRGGFLSTGSNGGSNINPFGITALAGLVGMFSKQATDKLDEVFNTLFRTAPGQGDAKRKDNLKNPVPSINDVEPKNIETPAESLIVKVKGTGFVKGSVVRVNETNRETVFVNESEVTVSLLPEDVKNEGELSLTIFNPEPGGGESRPIKIKIAAKGEKKKEDNVL